MGNQIVHQRHMVWMIRIRLQRCNVFVCRHQCVRDAMMQSFMALEEIRATSAKLDRQQPGNGFLHDLNELQCLIDIEGTLHGEVDYVDKWLSCHLVMLLLFLPQSGPLLDVHIFNEGEKKKTFESHAWQANTRLCATVS